MIVGEKYEMTYLPGKGDDDVWQVELVSLVRAESGIFKFKLIEAVNKVFTLVDWVEDMFQFPINKKYFQQNYATIKFVGPGMNSEIPGFYPVEMVYEDNAYFLTLKR
jgi:hypothetical protein